MSDRAEVMVGNRAVCVVGFRPGEEAEVMVVTNLCELTEWQREEAAWELTLAYRAARRPMTQDGAYRLLFGGKT